jgi:lactate permease
LTGVGGSALLARMADFVFAALPIAFLVFVMTKRNPLSSPLAFLLAALLALGIRFFFFGSSGNLLGAAVVAGLLSALTPIAIVFGAIFFFVAMEKSGAMDVIRDWLRGVSPHPVAQLMVVGWAFQFLIEGGSGFGTPAALAAPILAGLGFPAVRVAILCLVLNSVSVSFGAVGTPMWFGFGALGLSEPELLAVGVKAAFLQAAAALVIPVVALIMVVGWKVVRRSLVFIYLSILACVVPMVAMAWVNYEFPTVVGGLIGLLLTIFLAQRGIGLKEWSEVEHEKSRLTGKVLLALSPIAATVAILLVTRVPFLGFRTWLTSPDPHLEIGLGGWGQLTVSPFLVVEWRDILGEGLVWSHALLYVPSIIPFLLTSVLVVVLFKGSGRTLQTVLGETAGRLRQPILALLGALVFVRLLMIDGDRSSTMILGNALADGAGGAWIYFAPCLGALGSFFSGSATISNLTFGAIQTSIAARTGIDPATLLALQSGGAAMGNMVAIHNIVAVCAVLGLVNQEGAILKKTFPPVVIYGVTFAVVVLCFF